MKRFLMLAALVALTSVTGACGDKENVDLDDLFNDDGTIGSYDGTDGEADDGDNFWASDASDSAGNFYDNGEGYVCVDGVCY